MQDYPLSNHYQTGLCFQSGQTGSESIQVCAFCYTIIETTVTTLHTTTTLHYEFENVTLESGIKEL